MTRRGAPNHVTLSRLVGHDSYPDASWSQIAVDRMRIKVSGGVRDVLPRLSLMDEDSSANVPLASVTCTAADGDQVRCSGGDAVVRRTDLVFAGPLPVGHVALPELNIDVR